MSVNYKIVGYVTYDKKVICYITERPLENRDVVFKPYSIDIEKTILEIKSLKSIKENIGDQTNFRVTQDKKIMFKPEEKEKLKSVNLDFFLSKRLGYLTSRVNKKLKRDSLYGSIEEMGYNLYHQVPYYSGGFRDLDLKVYKMLDGKFTVYIKKRSNNNMEDSIYLLRCSVKDYNTLVNLIYEMVR